MKTFQSVCGMFVLPFKFAWQKVFEKGNSGSGGGGGSYAPHDGDTMIPDIKKVGQCIWYQN